MTISEAIKQIRLRLDMTQQQWAQHTGLAISTVVRYEHDSKPSAAIISRLAQIATENGWSDVAVVLNKATGTRLEIVARLSRHVASETDQLLSAAMEFQHQKSKWKEGLSPKAEADIADLVTAVYQKCESIKGLVNIPDFNPYVVDKDGHAAIED